MRRVAFLTAGALVGAAAFGQDPLECVDPDVLRALVFPGGAGQSTLVTSGVPAELSAVHPPSQFSLIGSTERDLGAVLGNSNARILSAVYRTSLSPDVARTAALDALAADGWDVHLQQPQLGSGVFVSASQPISQAACRDGAAISVTASSLDGKTYVTYGTSIGANSSACDPRLRAPYALQSSSDEYMPTLALPADPTTGAPAQMRGGGGGGSGSARNARAEFRVNESVRNVADFFARQMADQGWTADAAWSGTTTAGSSWSRAAESGTVHGTLQVTAVDDGQFTAILTVVTLS